MMAALPAARAQYLVPVYYSSTDHRTCLFDVLCSKDFDPTGSVKCTSCIMKSEED